MYIRNNNSRPYVIFAFFIIFLIFIGARLIFIQIFRKQFLTSLAKKQHNVCLEIEPARGNIYDRNLKPQTSSINLKSLYAIPREIEEKDKERIASGLSRILGSDKNEILRRLKMDKSFIWIARKISPQLAEEIEQLNFPGLDFIREVKRSYPNKELASHILGYAGLDNYGLEGVELTYEEYLRGAPGRMILIRDGTRKTLPIVDEYTIPPKDGYDIVLTIDESIQYIAERELDKVFKEYKAKGASIIVMEPSTGKILALANRPTFDPNKTDGFLTESRRNRAICDFFEPGSVFKIVTAVAALEENVVKEEDVFFCENGEYKIGNHILHDHRPHGDLTFCEVIHKSSNIGVTKIAQLLGPDIIYRYIKLFGFGELLKVDLPGEVAGVAKSPRSWSKISIGAIPIGQEVCVTALQLASAISAVANGGWLMRPYVIEKIQDKDGEIIKEFKPVPIRHVISQETAVRASAILTGVVHSDAGTGKKAAIEGYKVAGKTGTAQKIDPAGGYSHSKFIATFIGFAPADDPALAIVVTVDEPRPYYYGGLVAAPVFKNVAKETLKYLEIYPNIGEKNEVAKVD